MPCRTIGNAVEDEGARILAEAMVVPGAVSINLDDNKIGDVGARSIARAISALSQSRYWGSLAETLATSFFLQEPRDAAGRLADHMARGVPFGMTGTWPPGPEGRQRPDENAGRKKAEFVDLRSLSLTGPTMCVRLCACVCV